MQEDISTSDFIIDEQVHSDSVIFTDIHIVPSNGYNVLAKAKRGGRWWILKGLKEEYRNVPTFQDAQAKEYDVLSQLKHAGIVSVETMDDVEGIGRCMVMEYVEGMNLRDALAQGMSLATRKRVARELLDAVEYIHRKQIVHRDIKPSNIMLVGDTGYIKLIDFGLSDGHVYDYLKQPSGTQQYMSPEQKESSVPDFRNDIYSIGCVLEDLNLGRRYKNVINKCKQPADKRYQTVDALRAAFHKAECTSLWIWGAAVFAVLMSFVVCGIRYHWMDDVYKLAHEIHLTEYDFQEDGIYYNVISEEEATVEVTHNGGINTYTGDVTVPDYVQHSNKTYKVVRIGDDAFRQCNGVVAVVMPQTIKSIGNNSFLDSDSLATLNFPDSISDMGDSVVRNCACIRSIRLPQHMTEVPPYCFSGCWNLNYVYLHEGITTLKRDAFGGCAFETIEFPKSLRTIERGVFWACYRLKKITIPASVDRIGDFVFWHCDSLTDVYAERKEPLKITNIFQDLKDVTLHVPKGSGDAYRKAEGWKALKVVDDE